MIEYVSIWSLYQYFYGALIYVVLGGLMGMWLVYFEKQPKKMIIGAGVFVVIIILFTIYYHHNAQDIINQIINNRVSY